MLLSRSVLGIFNRISDPGADWHSGAGLTFSRAILSAPGTGAAGAASIVDSEV